jgi:uncharacterized protein
LLFGTGGAIGIYPGARAQKFVPQRYINPMLGILIILLSIRYITPHF